MPTPTILAIHATPNTLYRTLTGTNVWYLSRVGPRVSAATAEGNIWLKPNEMLYPIADLNTLVATYLTVQKATSGSTT